MISCRLWHATVRNCCAIVALCLNVSGLHVLPSGLRLRNQHGACSVSSKNRGTSKQWNKDKQSLHFKVSAFSILLPFGPQDPVVHHFRHPVGSGFPWFSPSLRHRDRIHQGSQAVWCNRKPGSATTARRASCRSAEPWSQRRFCLEMNGERLIPWNTYLICSMDLRSKWSEMNTIQNDPISCRSQGGICTSFSPIAWKKNF